jgi:TorA maturation chaperone TorD
MTTDFAQTALLRSDAYRLLAACFYEPEREMFIEENLCANLADLMAKISSPAASEACRGMELANNSQEELLQEYAALFLGPFNIPAQPYGSVYLDQGRQLMGDSTMAVKKIYGEAGVQHDIEGPPDHIAIELEFMSFLEQKICQAAANADTAAAADFSAIQSRFFNGFLANWAPLLGKAMKEHAGLTFYRALGECLTDFIAEEQRRLQKLAAATP